MEYFNLIFSDVIGLINLCEKDETCDDKDDYKILYDDHFLKEETSREFQFKLNEKIIEYIKKNKMITYPKRLFRGSYQGNFLHFIYLVYNKRFPLYFTLDQILFIKCSIIS